MYTMSETDIQEETLSTSSYTESETGSDNESETLEVAVDLAPKTVPRLSSLISSMKKIFKEEVINIGDDYVKLLIIATHAIMLESGFVCFDPLLGKKIEGFCLPNRWAMATFTTSIHYTLPKVLGLGSGVIETLVLRFQTLGCFFNIYGSLARNGSVVHRLCVKQNWFVLPLDLAFVDSDMIDARIEKFGSSCYLYPENEIFEFQKLVNDALAYPLSIDLCGRTGLLPPTCFMELPKELKFKILELLDGVDIAKVACVCSGLRDLCSNDDLWKQKFVEKIRGHVVGPTRGGTWKDLYVSHWRCRQEEGISPVVVAGRFRIDPDLNWAPAPSSPDCYIIRGRFHIQNAI